MWFNQATSSKALLTESFFHNRVLLAIIVARYREYIVNQSVTLLGNDFAGFARFAVRPQNLTSKSCSLGSTELNHQTSLRLALSRRSEGARARKSSLLSSSFLISARLKYGRWNSICRLLSNPSKLK